MAEKRNATARQRRAEYIRLRLEEGLDPVSAAGRLDLPFATRMRYENWLEAEHPELAASRPGRNGDWWRFQ